MYVTSMGLLKHAHNHSTVTLLVFYFSLGYDFRVRESFNPKHCTQLI